MKSKLKASFSAALASLLVAGLCFFVYHKWSSRRPPEITPVTQGLENLEQNGIPKEALEILDLQSSNKTKINLPSLTQESAIIVNFWASWCEPCAREIPSMLRLADHFSGKLKIVAISADDDAQEAQKFSATFKLSENKNVVVLLDKNKAAQIVFGVQRLPESFLFQKGGQFVRKVIGVDQWYTPQSIEFVTVELLQDKSR